jgi:MFS family permease
MWLAKTTPQGRRAVWAAYGGYGLDGFDFMVYSFIVPSLLTVWGMSKAEAGYIGTGALLTSAVGGWAAGVLADRFGRVRILQLTVLWFAAFTFLSGFTQNFGQLFFTRAMQGFGFGGEWAVGSILVAEVVDPAHRGQAAGWVQSSWSVGWAAAALAFWLVSAIAPPELAWKIVFWLGLLPGLLVLYIRRNVEEPAVFLKTRDMRSQSPARSGNFLDIFRPPLLATTLLATALSTGMLAAYYSVTLWLPTFLATERHLSVAGTTGYLLMVILGSWAGYLVSAWLTDLIGRRLGFISFAFCGGVLILLYTHLPVAGGMFLIGFPLGFFLLGIFSGMGAFLSELFPSRVRGSGQGFTYSMGRAIGGFCPLIIGRLSSHIPLGDSIGAFTAAAYALVIVTALALPETRGKVLEAT